MDNRSLTYEGYNRFLMGNHKRRRKGWQTVKNYYKLEIVMY
jgi:hypothetical protein